MCLCSDDEMMYEEKDRDESDKYQDKGVEDEEGLRKIVESGDEDEDEEDKKEEENDEDDDTRTKDGKDKGFLLCCVFLLMSGSSV